LFLGFHKHAGKHVWSSCIKQTLEWFLFYFYMSFLPAFSLLVLVGETELVLTVRRRALD
jgi:hypothetical protein